MKKSIKTLMGILIGILIFFAGCRFLNLMLVQGNVWQTILFHSYYTLDRDIDYAFIGSSHVLCDVEPFLLDEINGGNNFNMSCPQQRFDTSYYLLREMAEHNKLKHVYLECYYLCMTDHEIWDKTSREYKVSDYIGDPAHFASAWLISYAMKPSVNSLAIQLNASDKDHMIENLVPFVRYREKLFDWEFMSDNLRNNTSKEPPQYFLRMESEEPDGKLWCQEYREKGDHYSDGCIYDSEKKFPTDRDLIKYGMGSKSEKYLRKCIEYCQSKGIPVTVFVSPVMDYQLLSTGDYDNYVRKLKSLSDEYRVDFYDFNLIKREYLDIKHGQYFMDPEHLNTEGATLYTKALWDVVSRSRSDNEGIFYDSYEEYLEGGDPEILGLFYSLTEPSGERNEDGSPIYSMKEFTVASNRNDMRYRITYHTKDEDAKETVISEDSDGKSFSLPVDQTGTITVETTYEGKNLSLSVDF